MLSPLLREIHRLRKLIRDAQGEIDRAPKVLKAAQAKLAGVEKSVADAKEELKKRKAGVLTAEAQIKSLNQTLKKHEKQSEGLTSPRDIEAKSHDIQNTKDLIAKQEEEYLLAVTDVDERTAKTPGLDASLVKAKADFASFEKDASERIARLKEEVAAASKLLAVEEVKIPQHMRGQYDRLLKAHGADALAAAENQSCSYCRVGITAQQLADIQKESEFLCCRNCGRGLYLA
jgi:uncharacterized protein